jgi:transcription elongation factor Elf1
MLKCGHRKSQKLKDAYGEYLQCKICGYTRDLKVVKALKKK